MVNQQLVYMPPWLPINGSSSSSAVRLRQPVLAGCFFAADLAPAPSARLQRIPFRQRKRSPLLARLGPVDRRAGGGLHDGTGAGGWRNRRAAGDSRRHSCQLEDAWRDVMDGEALD